jgi:hypothetical protein
MTEKPVSDEEAQRRLDEGDSEKIDRKLDELDVSKTSAGNDQIAKPDPPAATVGPTPSGIAFPDGIVVNSSMSGVVPTM